MWRILFLSCLAGGNVRRTPFETASVTPRRHAACWACVWQSCVNKAMWEYAGSCRETWGKTECNRWTNRGGDGKAARPYEGACKWEITAVKSAGIEWGVLRAGLKWEKAVCVIPLFQSVMFALLAHSAPCLIPLATDTPWEEGLLFPIFSCV